MSSSVRLSTIPAHAGDDKRVSPPALRTLLVLGSYSSPRGWVAPSQEALALRMGVSQPTVSRTINELARYGYVTIRHVEVQGGGAKWRAEYFVHLDVPLADEHYRITPEALRDRRQQAAEARAVARGEDIQSLNIMPAPAPEDIQSLNIMPTPPPEDIQSLNIMPAPAPEDIQSLNIFPPQDPEDIQSLNTAHSVTEYILTLTKNEENERVNEGHAPPALAPPVLPRDKPFREVRPSYDGQAPLLWYENFRQTCYDGRLLPNDSQYKRYREDLRVNYPLDVVIAFWEFKQAQFGDKRLVTPKMLAEDIQVWRGLPAALAGWAARHDPPAPVVAPPPPTPAETAARLAELDRQAQAAHARAVLLERCQTDERAQAWWHTQCRTSPQLRGDDWFGALFSPATLARRFAVLVFADTAARERAVASGQLTLARQRAARHGAGMATSPLQLLDLDMLDAPDETADTAAAG